MAGFLVIEKKSKKLTPSEGKLGKTSVASSICCLAVSRVEPPDD